MIVVDTNIICYRWIPSSYSTDAERALAKDADWIAPLLWRSEFRNALAGALRQNLVTLTVANEIAAKAKWHFVNREFAVSSRDVLDLIANSGCSAYECEFVALAHANGARLLTVDRQILHEFPEVAVSLKTFIRD